MEEYGITDIDIDYSSEIVTVEDNFLTPPGLHRKYSRKQRCLITGEDFECGIASIAFSPNGAPNRLLAAARLDGAVQIFDVPDEIFDEESPRDPTPIHTYSPHNGAALCVVFASPSTLYTGGADNFVKRFSVSTKKVDVVGEHSGSVNCLAYNHSNGILISGSSDGTVKLWDANSAAVEILACGEEVLALDATDKFIVVGTEGGNLLIWDMKNLREPLSSFRVPTEGAIRGLKCCPTGELFAAAFDPGFGCACYFPRDDDGKASNTKFFSRADIRSYLADLQSNYTPQVLPIQDVIVHPVERTLGLGDAHGAICFYDPFCDKEPRDSFIGDMESFTAPVVSTAISGDQRVLAAAATRLPSTTGKTAYNSLEFRNLDDAYIKKFYSHIPTNAEIRAQTNALLAEARQRLPEVEVSEYWEDFNKFIEKYSKAYEKVGEVRRAFNNVKTSLQTFRSAGGDWTKLSKFADYIPDQLINPCVHDNWRSPPFGPPPPVYDADDDDE